MKRIAFIIGGASLFAWGISGALAGCGGDDGSVAIDPDAGGASTSSGGSSSGAASSSGGSSSGNNGGDAGDAGADGGDAGEAGADGGGGVQSNPGKISCGAAECTIPAQMCCRQQSDAGCGATNAQCFGQELGCDEKADCPNAEICCRTLQGDQQCQNANQCDGFGETVVCKSNTECADGGACKLWSCPGGAMIRSCTMPFNGCQ